MRVVSCHLVCCALPSASRRKLGTEHAATTHIRRPCRICPLQLLERRLLSPRWLQELSVPPPASPSPCSSPPTSQCPHRCSPPVPMQRPTEQRVDRRRRGAEAHDESSQLRVVASKSFLLARESAGVLGEHLLLRDERRLARQARRTARKAGACFFTSYSSRVSSALYSSILCC